MNDISKICRIIQESNDERLSPFACPNSDAVRKEERQEEIRPAFSIDRDRIMYSGAYKRLAGKTQVIYFSSLLDEQITNRIIHIQYVAQVARTIGKALRLNQDLIEASALGHDLGHTAFGHDGERYLNDICIKNGIGTFHHNIHSLYIVEMLSYRGKGMNLTLQTKDAIVSHNGEVHESRIVPQREKTEDDILKYLDRKADHTAVSSAMTLEGCVLKVSDTIAYIGTDIEDAIRLGLIERRSIPESISKVLGNNNSSIIDTLVKDIIMNSYENDYLEFSPKVSKALKDLKSFNYQNIYLNDKLKKEREKIKHGFKILFESFLSDLNSENRDSDVYAHFLNSKNERYLDATNDAEKVRDYIASMTDRYYKYELEKITIPLIDFNIK